jgi:uncharacterized protein
MRSALASCARRDYIPVVRFFWLSIGALSVLLGAIGAALPLMPTVPFLLLAAFSFARSSPRFHDWLLNHRVFGPPIRDWHLHGAIKRRAKWLATASIAAAFAVSLALGMPGWVLTVQAVVLIAVAIFIWTRPEGRRNAVTEDVGGGMG